MRTPKPSCVQRFRRCSRLNQLHLSGYCGHARFTAPRLWELIEWLICDSLLPSCKRHVRVAYYLPLALRRMPTHSATAIGTSNSVSERETHAAPAHATNAGAA